MPLKWEELGKVYPTDFTILTVPERLAYIGDLWAGILEKKIDLVKLISGMDLDSRLADIKAKYPG
jgi:DNA primase